MEIILIAAMAANRVIGDSVTNSIPWHVPGEQHRFKETTMGFPLLMGRKTYESIGRPLPGRPMLIVSRNPDYHAPGCRVVASIEDAFALCALYYTKIFIIGGETIYRQTLNHATHIILTTLEREVAGDIIFPLFDTDRFSQRHTEVIAEPESYTITTYERRDISPATPL